VIGLLIDAAIAVVVVLDRVCSAVEVRLQATSPGPVETHLSPGVGSAAPDLGGHPEPLRWGPESEVDQLRAERDEARACFSEAVQLANKYRAERDKARAERDTAVAMFRA
jgi:hypothetical protein